MASEAAREAFRRAWAIDAMLAAHPEMSRVEAAELCERVISKSRATVGTASEPRIVRLRLRRSPDVAVGTEWSSRLGLALASIGIAIGCVAVAGLIGGWR